ncbi:hypothetical protein K438DRAFT_1992101 [Mycena galopus ATCC 62051]|nr:hypothetical protein K438DRAFT_1992101 [Mycena galopus ATCC 62051]
MLLLETLAFLANITVKIVLHISTSFDLDPFTLRGTFMADTPAKDVYLFLLPVSLDTSDGHLAAHLPAENETYYWSFDRDGSEKLPPDSIEELGLPHVTFQAYAYGRRWDRKVYDTIANFHRTKGFDPYSEDVAIKLGYPLLDIDAAKKALNTGGAEVVEEDELKDEQQSEDEYYSDAREQLSEDEV